MLPTEVVFGPPGVVYFDASDVKKDFPLPEELRVFGSELDYWTFLQDELNAVILYDEFGEPDGFDLTVVTLDRPVYFDSSLNRFMDVENALGSYVAGLTGFILIEDDLRCVNPLLCLDVQLAPRYSDFMMLPIDTAEPREVEVKAETFLERVPMDRGCSTESRAKTSIDRGEFNWLSIFNANACEACRETDGGRRCIDVVCRDAEIFLTLSARMVETFVDAGGNENHRPHATGWGYNTAEIEISYQHSSRSSTYACPARAMTEHTAQTNTGDLNWAASCAGSGC